MITSAPFDFPHLCPPALPIGRNYLRPKWRLLRFQTVLSNVVHRMPPARLCAYSRHPPVLEGDARFAGIITFRRKRKTSDYTETRITISNLQCVCYWFGWIQWIWIGFSNNHGDCLVRSDLDIGITDLVSLRWPHRVPAGHGCCCRKNRRGHSWRGWACDFCPTRPVPRVFAPVTECFVILKKISIWALVSK